MKHKAIISAAALATTLSFSSCTLSQLGPDDFHGDYTRVRCVEMDQSDRKMICSRAMGQSVGFRLLGLITIKDPSEAEAIKNMYEDASSRGAKIEGETSYFTNKAVERTSKFYLLYSRPTITASGDLMRNINNPQAAKK